MRIAGYNITPKNMWDDITNVKRYEGLTQSEFMSTTYEKDGKMVYHTYEEFVKNVQGTMSRNKTMIEQLDEAPLGGILNLVNAPNQESVLQVSKSISQWELARDIVNSTGKAIGWDLETVGDITSRQYDEYAGITEFGIVERQYVDGKRIMPKTKKARGYALAIGFDENQAGQLRMLVNKFKAEGWNSLNNSEQSTLQRLSMIGSKVENGKIVPIQYVDRFHEEAVSYLGNKRFLTVTPLGPSNFDPETMLKAIEIQRIAYNAGATPENVLPNAIKYITDAAKAKDTFLYGGNIEFDVNATKNIATKAGINFESDLVYSNTVDVVYGTRTIAVSRTESVGTLSDSFHRGEASNKNQSAAINSQMETQQMKRGHFHYSPWDIENTLDLITINDYDNGQSYIDTVIDANSHINISPYDTQDSVFLLNRGHIQNDSADLVLINGEPSMQTYPMSNDYWTLGTHSGYVPVEDGYGNIKESYMLELINASDENVKAYKAFDSIEDGIKFISKNSTIIESSKITAEELEEQYLMNVLDIGRREYDNLFDIKSVSVNNGADEKGYAALKQYLALYEELDGKQGFENKELTLDLINKIKANEAGKNRKDRILKSEYQVRAFAGMFEKISDEKELLDEIKNVIENKGYKEHNNATKTAMAAKARNAVIDAIESQQIDVKDADGNIVKENRFARYETDSYYYTLNDIYGVDIKTPDGAIHRINASSTTNAIPNISYALKNLDNEQIESVINDLAERQVINQESKNKLLHSLYANDTLNGNYNFSEDLAYALTKTVEPLKNSSNPIEIFADVILSEESADNVALKNKNIQLIADNLHANAKSRYTFVYGATDAEFTLSQLYKAEKLKNVVNNTISEVDAIPIDYYDNPKSFKGVIEGLQEKLNLSPSETKLVQDIFDATDKNGNLKSYSIEAYKQEGLQAFVLDPGEANKNAYILVTNQKHSDQVMDILINGNLDPETQLDNYTHVREVFDKHATVIELHSVNRYELTDLPQELDGIMGGTKATLTSINRSNKYENFVTPILDVYQYGNKVQAEIKGGIEDLYSATRMSGKRAFRKIIDEDAFDVASAMIRRTQNDKMKALTAPSSYRGHYVNGVAKRIANYHPADFLHAYEVNIKGLRTLMDQFASMDSDNVIKQMLFHFNTQQGVVASAPGMPLSNSQYKAILDSNAFNEFYVKNLFSGMISSDESIASAIKSSNSSNIFDKSIFSLLKDAVNDDITGLFDDSVSSTLSNFEKTIPYINQVLPESAVAHHLISYVKPGDFNVLAGLYSTLRPTYTQINRPLYFEIDDATRKIMETDKISGEYTYIGQASVSKLEYDIKTGLADKLKTPSGKPFDAQHRSISTRFKQISDVQLQAKYDYIDKNLNTIASKLGLDKNKLRTTFNYMRNDMSSLYEGKWFYDPLLGNKEFFTAPDAKKVSIFDDIENIDIKRTQKQLNKFKNKEVVPGSVIGVTKSGKPILYKGPSGVMTDFNVSELLQEGHTYIIPKKSAINDIKLMIDSEKAMAHTIDSEKLLKYARGVIDSADEALKYSHALFQEVFDKSMVAGTMNAFKHNNNFATSSVWNTIATEYVRAGQGETLFNMLTRNEILSPYFKDWNVSLGKNGQIVVHNSESKNLTRAVLELESLIREKPSEIGSEIINKKIIKHLNYQNEHNIITANVQRELVNEHLSDMFKLDQRIEQSIRLRSWQPGDPLSTANDSYLTLLKEYSMSEDLGVSDEFLNSRLGNIKEVADIYNTQKLADVRNYNAAVKNNRRNAIGIRESLKYYADPSQFDTNKVLQVNISDLIKDGKIPKSGVSKKELEQFLFYVNGKPSKWLSELAAKQSKRLQGESFSLYINLEKTVRYDGKTLNGVMIPIHNVITNIQDNQFLNDSQRITTRFLNDIVNVINAPEKKGQKSIVTVLDTYVKDLAKQSAIMKKDSDMYKGYGRIALANAGQYQAIDETPAIIDSMMKLTNSDLKNLGLVEQQKAAKDILAKGSVNPKDIAEYDRITEQLKAALKKSADEIRNAKGDTLPELTALKTSPFKSLSTKIIDGKAYYNNLVAIGEEGFKARGYDFGQVGMDLVSTHFEGGKSNYSKIPSIANKKPFRVTDEEIRIVSERLKNLGIEDIDEKNLLTSLNSHIKKQYGTNLGGIDTTKVNNAIISGKLKEIFGTFEDIGKRYTREVGVLADHYRYPVFGSQPIVNVVLDDTIEGLGIRFFNPVMSTYTNADFDGDTTFLALNIDGGSIAKITNERFYRMLKEYEKGVKLNNNLLAELIEEGDAFKLDNLNDYRATTAHMLESFKQDKYIEAVSGWAKDNNISFKSIKDLSSGQILAAEYSSHMAKAWNEAELNTLLDKNVIHASLAVSTRKPNIGSVSTPNFKLRTVIEELANDTSFDEAQHLEFREILHNMSNSNTSMRGLTDIVEQKGIDVKHIVDAFGIAQTNKWSLGLTQMFSPYQNRRKEGLTNLVKASNHILFGNASDSEIEAIVDDIMSHSREDFKKLATHTKDDLATAKLYLRGVYDISLQEKAIDYFNLAIKDGVWGENFQKYILNVQASDIPNETLMSNFIEGLVTAQSDASILLEEDFVYMRTGDIDGDLLNSAWMYKGTSKNGAIKLQQVSLEADNFLQPIGKIKHIGKAYNTNIEINKQIDDFFHGHQGVLRATAHALRESPEIFDKLYEATTKQTSIDILNKLLLNKDGSLRAYDEKAFTKLKTAGALYDFSHPSISKWFDFNNNVSNITNIYNEVKEIGDLYEYAIKTENLGNKPALNALIKEINQDIVNNPDKYGNKTEFHSYSDILRTRITETLGGQQFVDRIANKKAVVGNFNKDAFQESLDFLNSNLYDIINEEAKLNKSFESIQIELDGLDKTKVADNIKPLEDLIASSSTVTKKTIESLQAANKATISKTEQNIYKLFNSTAQMNALFEWNNVSGYSKVGFGEYIGVQFKQLTVGDIKSIQESIDAISSKSLKNMTEMQRHAIEQTKKALNEYKPKINNTSYTPFARKYLVSDAVEEIVYNNNKILTEVYSSFSDRIEEVVKPKEVIQKKTIPKMSFDSAKDALSKVSLKTVGIAGATLAAIGIANNLLHNQKSQSPLTPARRSGGNGAPNYNNGQVDSGASQAPMSKRKTVYHDSGSGFNFKVSAKTQNYINDMNNAKLIGMSGGGNPTVYSQSDTSGVTDNWLANKFAELT